MVRIIHAADFHLDSAFSGLPPEKARQRRRESREILDRLTALARERQADLVLLAGDLFDGERVYPETLERLREALAALACPVFIAPGNHDPFTPRSPYARQTWPENVHIFRGGALEAVELPELGCVVHGAAFTAPERTDQVLAGFTAPADGLVHILCLHGEVNAPASQYGPITREQIAEKRRAMGDTRQAAAKKTLSEEVCLEVDHLRMSFPLYRGMMKRKVGEVHAVQDVSFTVHTGETLGIVGESGCGKSTLAKCIMRALNPAEGKILYKGTDIAHMKERELKPIRSKITMIFQDPIASLDPRQTAESIVGEPLRINHLVRTKEEYDARIDELFRLVGLNPAYRTRVPREFSGGQRQRLGIARALASNPDVIICDEPVSALDVSVQAQVINLLEELQAKLHVTYLFIAHDLSVVKHISDRVMVMYLGRVMETANAETLYENPLHPYTKALLSAVPISDPKVEAGRERIKLLGEVPSVLERPKGCPFCERCQYATDRCRAEVPPLRDRGNGQAVACFLYE